MSGFKLKLGGSQAGKFADYTHVLEVLFAKTCRLLWSSTDTPSEANADNGIGYRVGGVGAGPGVVDGPVETASSVTVGEQYSNGAQQLLMPSHGLDVEQSYLMTVVSSDNAADVGWYHVRGVFSDEMHVSQWIQGTVIDVEFWTHSAFVHDKGGIQASCEITDETDSQAFGHMFHSYIGRGNSDGTTVALGVDFGGARWPKAKLGGRCYGISAYRYWYYEQAVFFADAEGICVALKALGAGCQDPRGLLDVTPTNNFIKNNHAGDIYSHPFPERTTAQREALSGLDAGAHVFDTTLNRVCVWDGSAWVQYATEAIS